MTNSKLKDSNIEWLGKIPSNWRLIHNKYILKKKKEILSKYDNEKILSLTMNGVIERDLNAGGKMPSSFDGYQKLKKDNLLLCLFDIDVTPRCVGIIPKDGITSPAYSQFILNKKEAYLKYYYYYFLMLDNKKVLVHLSKNLRNTLSEQEFGSLTSLMPPLEEQKKISTFLDKKIGKIDKVSKKIQQEITDLEKYRRSIITKAVTKGIDKNVPMKDSGIDWIGKIPKNWDLEKVKFLCTKLERGTTPDYTEAHCTKVINQATFSKGFFDDKNIKYSTKNAQSSRGLVQKGDVLIASTGGGVLGKVFYFNQNGIYVADSHVTILRTNNKYKSKLAYYILSVNYELINGLMAQGSTNQIELQRDLLANFYLPVPDSKNQKDIITFLDNKCSKIKQIINYKQHELNKLAHYKQAIIYEYVTGKKQVPKDEGAKA